MGRFIAITWRDALLEALPGVSTLGLDDAISVGWVQFPRATTLIEVPTTPVDVAYCLGVEAVLSAQPLGGKNASQRAALRNAIEKTELGPGTRN